MKTREPGGKRTLARASGTLLMPFVGLIFVILLFVALIAIFQPQNLDKFLGLNNARTIITQTVIVGIGALGMTMVIASGGIDLSAGSQIALTSVICALMINAGTGDSLSVSGMTLVVAVLVTAGSGTLCGLFNGFVSAVFRIAPFIVTLGMMLICRGTAEWLAKQEQVRTPASAMRDTLMARNPEPEWLLVAPGVWIMLFLLVAVAVVMRFTVFGRYIYALGSNEMTARLCGIPVARTRIVIYVLCGGFMAVSGVMSYAYIGSGDPTTAVAKELDIIAAVVIGGGSLSGGKGNVVGSIIGALIMTILVSGCSMLRVPDYTQKIITGFIIIGAVGIDNVKNKRRLASGQ